MSKSIQHSAAKSFTEKLLSFAHICIPNKIVTVRPNDKPWYDSKIRVASRKRDRLKNKASKSNNSNVWMKYKNVEIMSITSLKRPSQDISINLIQRHIDIMIMKHLQLTNLLKFMIISVKDLRIRNLFVWFL